MKDKVIAESILQVCTFTLNERGKELDLPKPTTPKTAPFPESKSHYRRGLSTERISISKIFRVSRKWWASPCFSTISGVFWNH